MKIEFRQCVLPSGNLDPNRWESIDGQYTIARYRYYRADGRTCGLADKCEPYFRAYGAHGKLIGDHKTKHPTFSHAAGACMDHQEG